MDKGKIDSFWITRTKIEDPRIATNYRDDGRLAYDIALVEKHLPESAKILDLGAGTCTLSRHFLGSCKGIVAVDKFDAFLEKAPDHPKLRKICADVADFSVDETFDLILLFGVANFLSSDEERQLYRSCAKMLREGGVLIVKNQCGVRNDVIVDSYSEELDAHYYANYPSVDRQRERLLECFEVEMLDIYPAELNRWENTHFYAFVCSGKAS